MDVVAETFMPEKPSEKSNLGRGLGIAAELARLLEKPTVNMGDSPEGLEAELATPEVLEGLKDGRVCV